MATFPNIKPIYGSRKKSQPNIKIVRFDDGYEHRLLFGVSAHQNPKEFNLTYEVSETDADTIEAFLDARVDDLDSFNFPEGCLPGEGTSSQFVCEGWNKSMPYNNRANIRATFREVFEPAT